MKDPRARGPPSESNAADPAAASTPAARWTWSSVFLGTFYAVCVVGSLLVYGLWQERIMSQPYEGGSVHIFTYSVFLVVFTRIVGLAFALVMVVGTCEPISCQAPLWKYLVVSVPTVVASICQFEALRYMSFTMQILGKTSKTGLIMVGLRCCAGNRYKVVDWMVAFGVTAGVVLYMLTGPLGTENAAGSPLWGLALLGSFVVLDGVSSFVQEKLFSEERGTKYNQLLYNNLTAALLSVGIFLLWGRAAESLAFCKGHPAVYMDASIMSVSAMIAQWFVHMQVQDFGRLAFAATFNLRQIVSVAASYLVYGHAVTGPQIAGLSIVAVVLCFQSLAGWMHAQAQDEQRPLLAEADAKAPQGGGLQKRLAAWMSGGRAGGRDREAV